MNFWSHYTLDTTRRPQYAGSWYESNPAKLKQELDNFIAAAQTAPDAESAARVHVEGGELSGNPLAIIVPHAGYLFSGKTAAFAYKAAAKTKPNRIFLLGPSHHVGFRGVALPQSTAFATPLGDLDVDKELVAELATYPAFSVQPEVHKVEHSLELQLPFIKHCFDKVKIVPLVIGQIQDESEARLIGEILKAHIAKGDLVVVSSDFTHYGPRYGYMPFQGQENIPEKVCELDGAAFNYLKAVDLDGFADFLRKTEDTICGMFPCQVLLSILPEGAKGSLLKYASSRDTAHEDAENSVSYLAIAYSGADWPEAPSAVRNAAELIKLSEAERQSILKLAKETMTRFVKEKSCPTPEELSIEITPAMKQCFGVFVTIKIRHGPRKENSDLRGCIGSIYASKPLYKAVQENAISACSKDPRFIPVQTSELEHLELDVNVLTPPRRIASYKEIVIGRDGVILTKGRNTAVFLPQVAVEWKWTLEEMLTQLSLKAGLRPNDWREGCKFDTFQSEEIH